MSTDTLCDCEAAQTECDTNTCGCTCAYCINRVEQYGCTGECCK